MGDTREAWDSWKSQLFSTPCRFFLLVLTENVHSLNIKLQIHSPFQPEISLSLPLPLPLLTRPPTPTHTRVSFASRPVQKFASEAFSFFLRLFSLSPFLSLDQLTIESVDL